MSATTPLASPHPIKHQIYSLTFLPSHTLTSELNYTDTLVTRALVS